MSVIFTSKDISKKLKIGKSQVREISKQLEKEAYQFTKNQETRIYSEKDFTLIQIVLENYNKHQNLPQAVQYALAKLQRNSEKTNLLEEVPSSKQTIEFEKQKEASSNVVTDQIEVSSNKTEVADHVEASLNNNEVFDQIEISSNKIEVADHVEPSSNKIEVADHVEASLNKIEVADQIEVTPNKIEVSDHVVTFTNNDYIVSSSSKVAVSDQKSASNFMENERLLKNELPNSVEQHDVIVDNNPLELKNDITENSQQIDINGTQSQQFDEQADSHKLVEIDGQLQSNQIMFEEFMSQISNLATQNELILQQNQTLIKQNLLKDQKLEKILYSVEEKSEELQELASVIEEKDEKLEQMFEEIQVREVGRDAQLMRMIREMQETKKMVAATKEKDWKSSLKSFFIKPKTIK